MSLVTAAMVSPDGQKQHLVLVPGLLNDADLWSDQVVGLSDLAVCRVADITGAGTLGDLADAILAEAPARFAIAGFSLGGYVTQEVARRAPGRITRMALLDTSIRADTPARAAQRQALDRTARMPGRFHGFGERLFATYLDPSHLGDPAITGRIRAMTERLGVEVFLRQNRLERRDGADVLRQASGPVLILCGEHDVLTPLADHLQMASLVPGCMFVRVAESGHMTPIEQPGAVTAALRAWLAS